MHVEYIHTCTEWNLIICGFGICTFAYWLIFACNPQINTRGPFSHSRTCAEP